jgi:uncharacterized protein (TIGR03663 family)
LRPMHADEAVQAARFRKLWLNGEYRYDPNEFHGPTLPYTTLPRVWASGVSSFAETDEATYRSVTALFGCAVVVLAWLLVDGLGRPSTLIAAFFVALSPCLVFYSRYYIHETLVVFFSLAAIGSAWRYLKSTRKLAWSLACGVCLGCLQATKETSVIVFGGFFVATVGALSINWRRQEQGEEGEEGGEGGEGGVDRGFRWSHLVLAILVAVGFAALLLSSFLTNLRGPVDGILAYVPWLDRAASTSIHDHPWHFYLHRLILWHVANGPWWSEGMILLLATIAFAVALFRPTLLAHGVHRGLVCWLGFYALALITVYSAIPYKTPWCMIGFLQASALLAGVGATTLLRACSSRWWHVVISIILFVGFVHLGWQSYQASYRLAADPRNPYVYAHTSSGIQRFVGDLQQITAASPSGPEMTVKLIWDSNYYWPLPWYLRGFSQVEYWNRVPEDPSAALVISSPRHDQALSARLEETHLMTGYYELRPNVLAQLWVRDDVWTAHVKELRRKREARSQ